MGLSSRTSNRVSSSLGALMGSSNDGAVIGSSNVGAVIGSVAGAGLSTCGVIGTGWLEVACTRSADGVTERPRIDDVLVVEGFLEEPFSFEGKDRISAC